MQDYGKWIGYQIRIHPIASDTTVISKQYFIPLQNYNSNYFN